MSPRRAACARLGGAIACIFLCGLITEDIATSKSTHLTRMSRGSVYLALFLLLALAAAAVAAYAWWRGRASGGSGSGSGSSRSERFTDADAAPVAADSGSGSGSGKTDQYKARLSVQKAFAALVRRKPTPEEIDRYSTFKTDAAIRSAVAADFRESPDVSEAAEADASEADAAAEAPAKKSVSAAALDNAAGKSASDATKNESFGGFDQARPFRQDTGAAAAADADDDDDDDDDVPKADPRAKADPTPYSPNRVMKATEATPDLGWSDKAPAAGGRRRVCMDRSDVLKRLEALTDEIEQFRQMVVMM